MGKPDNEQPGRLERLREDLGNLPKDSLTMSKKTSEVLVDWLWENAGVISPYRNFGKISKAKKVRQMHGYPDRVSAGSAELVEEKGREIKRERIKAWVKTAILAVGMGGGALLGTREETVEPQPPHFEVPTRRAQVPGMIEDIDRELMRAELINMEYTEKEIEEMRGNPAYENVFSDYMDLQNALRAIGANHPKIEGIGELNELLRLSGRVKVLGAPKSDIERVRENLEAQPEGEGKINLRKRFNIFSSDANAGDATDVRWAKERDLPYFDIDTNSFYLSRLDLPIARNEAREVSDREMPYIFLGLIDAKMAMLFGKIDYENSTAFSMMGNAPLDEGGFGKRVNENMEAEELIEEMGKIFFAANPKANKKMVEREIYMLFRSILSDKKFKNAKMKAKLLEIVKQPNLIVLKGAAPQAPTEARATEEISYALSKHMKSLHYPDRHIIQFDEATNNQNSEVEAANISRLQSYVVWGTVISNMVDEARRNGNPQVIAHYEKLLGFYQNAAVVVYQKEPELKARYFAITDDKTVKDDSPKNKWLFEHGSPNYDAWKNTLYVPSMTADGLVSLVDGVDLYLTITALNDAMMDRQGDGVDYKEVVAPMNQSMEFTDAVGSKILDTLSAEMSAEEVVTALIKQLSTGVGTSKEFEKGAYILARRLLASKLPQLAAVEAQLKKAVENPWMFNLGR